MLFSLPYALFDFIFLHFISFFISFILFRRKGLFRGSFDPVRHTPSVALNTVLP